MKRINIVNEGEKFNKKKYEGALGDYDKDGLANIDDANPYTSEKNPQKVEQIELAKTFEKLLTLKNQLDDTMDVTIGELDTIAPKGSLIYARTKTPYSILKKLVEKRLTDKQRGLTDLVGTTIVVDDLKDLRKVDKAIKKGEIGKVVEREDMYKNPKGGYRAIHYLVEVDGYIVEVQLKTKRQKAINEQSHEAYKKGTLNSEYLLYVTDLANKADKGNRKAYIEFDRIIDNPTQLAKDLDTSFEFGGEIKRSYDVNINSGVGTYAKGGEVEYEDIRVRRLWNERGYDGNYLGSLSERELQKLYDTEFYFEENEFEYAKGGELMDADTQVEYANGGSVSFADFNPAYPFAKGGSINPDTSDVEFFAYEELMSNGRKFKSEEELYDFVNEGYAFPKYSKKSVRAAYKNLNDYYYAKGGKITLGEIWENGKSIKEVMNEDDGVTITYKYKGKEYKIRNDNEANFISLKGGKWEDNQFDSYTTYNEYNSSYAKGGSINPDTSDVEFFAYEELMSNGRKFKSEEELYDFVNDGYAFPKYSKKSVRAAYKNLNDYYYAKGGWIQDATAEMEKKGTIGSFTAKAKRYGLTPQEFAKKVLADDGKTNYTLKTKRQAQFMKNANPEMFSDGGEINRSYDVNINSGVGTYATGGVTEAGDVDFPSQMLNYAKGGVTKKEAVMELHKSVMKLEKLREKLAPIQNTDYILEIKKAIDNLSYAYNDFYQFKSLRYAEGGDVMPDISALSKGKVDNWLNPSINTAFKDGGGDVMPDASSMDGYAKGGKTQGGKFYSVVTLIPSKKRSKGDIQEAMKMFVRQANKIDYIKSVSVLDSYKGNPSKTDGMRVEVLVDNEDRQMLLNFASLFNLKYDSYRNAEKRDGKFVMAQGGKTQGYNSRLDESLAERDGAERGFEQKKKDRRDESKAMEKAKGKRAYASVKSMDKNDRFNFSFTDDFFKDMSSAPKPMKRKKRKK